MSAKRRKKLVETTELEPGTECLFCGKKLTKTEDVGQIDVDGVVYGDRKHLGFYSCKSKKCLERMRKINEHSKQKGMVYTKEDAETAQKIIDLLDESVKK